MSVNIWLNVLILTFIWAGVAGAWNLLAGYAGQFSLGHAAFFGIGAYAVVLLRLDLGVSPWLGIAAGAALAALVALGLAGVSLRARGPFFALISIAFAEVLRILAVYFTGITRGSQGVSANFPEGLANLVFANRWAYLAVSIAYAALVFLVCAQVRRSRLGFRLLAVREDETAARASGVPVTGARITATMLSAALTAIGGSLFALYVRFIDPDSVMSFFLSVEPALIAIVGGLGLTLGPLFGAFLVVPLEHVLRAWFGGSLSGLHGLIFGVLLIVILLTIPEGLVRAVQLLLRGRRHA